MPKTCSHGVKYIQVSEMIATIKVKNIYTTTFASNDVLNLHSQ